MSEERAGNEQRGSRIEDRESKIEDRPDPAFRSSIFDPRSSILWAFVQLLAILLAAGEIPVWAHHPYPRSSLALNELITVQVLAISLLCPILDATWWTVIVNAIVALAFLMLAGVLSNQPFGTIAHCWMLVATWKFGIYGLSRWIGISRRYYLVCGAMLFAGGDMILQYLRAEASNSFNIHRDGSKSIYTAHLIYDTLTLKAATPLLLWLLWMIASYLKPVVRWPSTSLH